MKLNILYFRNERGTICMYKMGVTRIFLVSLTASISFIMIGLTILSKYMITSSIPISYSREEYELFLYEVSITTLFLVLTLFLSKGYVKWITAFYGLLLILSVVDTIRSLTTMEQYQILLDLDKMFVFMYTFSCLVGLILMSFHKRYAK